MKNIFIVIFSFLLIVMSSSCSEENIGTSVIDTSSPHRTEFDTWILENYVKEYNIDFRYYLDDIESDMMYNLIPADLDKSKKLAKIIKYLWLESYDEVFDPTGNNKDFMRKYSPKMIQLVGCRAVNPNSGTSVLGTAEGGIKVVLYDLNSMDPTNIGALNKSYFHTMHHEFVHILHQIKPIPVEYKTITPSDYSPTGWQNRGTTQAQKLRFITPYASSEPQEDFAEMISSFLTMSDISWQKALEDAASDGSDGAIKINKKFEIAKNWLKTSWNIDIDLLKSIISRRSENISNILN